MSSADHAIRVLVVDDDHAVADSISLVLKTRRHIIRTAYDGEQAMAMAKEFRPQAVITDLTMPGMDGATLAVHLGLADPTCRIALFTAQLADAIEERLAAFPQTHFEVINKPMRPQQLLEFVQACADGAGGEYALDYSNLQ